MRHLRPLFLVVCVPSALVAQTDWTMLAPTTSPPARELQAMAYDIGSGGTLLFGGYGATGNLGDTWLWKGTTWSQLSPKTNPPPRHESAMTWFAAGVFLFGGSGNSSALGDTWQWTISDWKLLSPTTSPPARARHGLAYDSNRRRIVLFGGRIGTAMSADTWEWDGTNWSNPSPTAVPPVREMHRMVYDVARQRVVLFGGMGNSGPLADTWEYDGTNWKNLAPTTSPPARSAFAMSYDAARGRVVVFGGQGASGNLGDTWEFYGQNWVSRGPKTAPAARRWHVMDYDHRAARTLLFGGEANSRLADTWVYAPTFPASYTALGTGCPGNSGVPTLAAASGQLPWLGGTFRAELGNLPASGPVLMFLGLSKTQWGNFGLPLNLSVFNMPGCTLYTSLDFQFVLPNQNGKAVWNVGLPNDPRLLGVPFYNQAAVDAPGANQLGVVMSNAATGKVGGK